MKTHGYYPGFSTLAQQNFWETATRNLVLERVSTVPPIRFFSELEAELMEAVCRHILPQDDRDADRRIPIVPFIDRRLFEGRTAGYRFEDMPPDPQAYRLGLEAIELMALDCHKQRFGALGLQEREELLKSLHDAKPKGAHEIWATLPVHRFWPLLVQDCVEIYYAHPWAWDEIGFGGPAYPRAYMRLENGEPEPWEVEEQRYEWSAPEWALSDRYEPAGGPEHEPPGQEGTH